MINSKDELICDMCGDSPDEEQDCPIDEIDGQDLCYACRDTLTDDGWFEFSAYNSESRFGFGDMRQAETYCQILNSEREMNCYSIEEISDEKLIEDLENTRTDGFDLWCDEEQDCSTDAINKVSLRKTIQDTFSS